MKKQFDTVKNAENLAKHGLGFAAIDALDWSLSITREDDRINYGENRFVTYAPLDGRLHCLVWTPRDGAVRPISFRKANTKERRRYEKEKNRSA